jgi:hypothetical protein
LFDSLELPHTSAEYDGGAVWVYDASSLVTDCTFNGNSAKNTGGAVGINDGGKANVTGCSFILDNTGTPRSNKHALLSNRHCALCCTHHRFVYPALAGGGAIFCRGIGRVANCTFAAPTTKSIGHNDIFRFTDPKWFPGQLTFGCPDGTTGTPANMTVVDLLPAQLPPATEIVRCV